MDQFWSFFKNDSILVKNDPIMAQNLSYLSNMYLLVDASKGTPSSGDSPGIFAL